MNEIIKRFEYAISKDRLSHLYLLGGSLGMTKLLTAKEIAYLVLKNYQDYPALRGQIESLNHPNVIYIAKDGTSIKKEQIMALQTEFSKTSLVLGPRIFIIDQAELMSQSAANSLLKFLEEPKDEQTIGLLLVDEMNSVLPTILSRAQVIRMHDQSDEHFIEILKENDLDDKNAQFLNLLTKDVAEAMSKLSDPMYLESVRFIDLFIEWLKYPKSDLNPLWLNVAQALYQDKSYIVFMLDVLSGIFLDIMHIHMNQKIAYEFMEEQLLEFVKYISTNKASQIILLIQDTIKSLRLPVNINLNLTAFSIQVWDIINHG